ncbi:MAG TPA: hypothetical protein VLU43_09010 [Anaeromyxobacteraceae bacterium]|nr:hypothetical protein [Anaeromyxobacteraceae bacterium]
MTDPLDTPARHERLARLGLRDPALSRALDAVTEGPDRATWARIVDGTLLRAGRGLLVAGALLAGLTLLRRGR